mmetsp:Transcript_30004/g.45928  ORF Transcript_30004/g.45928 Transcript_30004/m.45928 type:complete len:284 (-) Transcript_30004:338-1189(-)
MALASWETFIDKLASARAELNQTSQAPELKQTKSRESQRRISWKIQSVRKKLQSNRIAMIKTVNAKGNIITLTDKHAIELAIAESNRKKFDKESHTPFLQFPLNEMLGTYGTGSLADAVLQGDTQVLRILPTAAKALLENLSWRENVPDSQRHPFLPLIETAEYTAFWKKAREYTSSGPSGLHFGHFKAGANRPHIAEFEACMTLIPLASGYSPICWRSCIDGMITKKAGSRSIENLRTIILFGVDFNYMNKYIGRKMMHRATDQDKIAPEQFGSRLGHRAID